jgi:AcrR family transcriptional regulator
MPSLSREDYFEAALDLVANEGFEALTIVRLCGALNVTAGSFYHHFRGSTDFLEALYGYWEDEHALRLVVEARAVQEPDARLTVLKTRAAQLPHASEAAIRAWSRSHPDVAAVQRRVDAARIEVVLDTLQELGLPLPQARLLADIAIAVLVGTQEIIHADSRGHMTEVFAMLEQWLRQAAESVAAPSASA